MVTTFQPFRGLSWRVVTTLPETAFLDEANQTQSRSVMIAGITVALALGLSFWLSSHLSRPLLRLTDHIRGIAQGDFKSKLSLGTAQELAKVSGELNAMAAGLKERMELERAMEVATKVQQSLLPEEDPRPRGLDIAGRSKYCETTGGDYFDFIDISKLQSGLTLIAVGDAMGHGIGAALLMASARAALRAHAEEIDSLGDLLTRVNRVLATGTRDLRFMTMYLLVIDPPLEGRTGSIRWASAGHDPVFICRVDGRGFSEPDGGGPPLGIDPFTEYQEYRLDELDSGDVLVVGTDGIWELKNAQNEFFGKQRFKDVIAESAARSAKEIAIAIETALAHFRQEVMPQDDVTFVVAKLTGAR